MERHDDRCCASLDQRTVFVPLDLSSDDGYLSALHEIGHVVMDEYVTESRWHAEFVAWGWAFAVARDIDEMSVRSIWPYFKSHLDGGNIRYQMPAPTFAHYE